jgi:uncharacterized protein (DUF924 family)
MFIWRRFTVGRPSAVLSFWYGEHEPLEKVCFSNSALWYKKDPDFDAQIRAQFEEDINRALRNEFDGWADESQAHGVALVVLLDQFSRNMYRGTPRMFAYDSKALAVSMKLIEKGWDRSLPLPMRYSVYLPLMHSEDLAVQRRLLEMVETMATDAHDLQKPRVAEFKDFALKHLQIIEKFGRFPHRNVILGRSSTPEEEAFLTTHPGF